MTVPMVISLRALWLGVCDLLDSVLPKESIDRSTSSCVQQQIQPSRAVQWIVSHAMPSLAPLLSSICKWCH